MKYEDAKREMETGAGGSFCVNVILAYTDKLKQAYGSRFDPIKALDDLIEWAQVFKKTLQR